MSGVTSIFTDKRTPPTPAAMKKALGDTFSLWKQVVDFTHKTDPTVTDDWKFTGEKTGWSFRVSDKKRVVVYMMPFDQYFQVSMVFGPKAYAEILSSGVAEHLKNELKKAPVYAEGRGLRIQLRDETELKDVLQLIQIKIGK